MILHSSECVPITLSLTAVTIVTEGDSTFRGFLVQAQNQNGDTIGAFSEGNSDDQQLLDCSVANQAAGVSLFQNHFYSSMENV